VQKRPSWTWRRLQSAFRRTGPTLVDPPLLGFVLVCAPPSTYPPRVHSPTASPRPFGPCAARHPDSFHPRGFSPPRRFAPHGGPRVCCAPKPNEVRCVSRHPPPDRASRSRPAWTGVPIPATRFTPFEEFPSPAAVPRHRGRCPPAVPAMRDEPCAEALVTSCTCRQVASRAACTTEVVPRLRVAPRRSRRPRTEIRMLCSRRPALSGEEVAHCHRPSLPRGQGLGPLSSSSGEELCVTCPNAEAPRRELRSTTR